MEDNNKSLVTFPIGTLLRDGDRIGIVYREIKSGTWTDQPLFNWRTNYEIYYEIDHERKHRILLTFAFALKYLCFLYQRNTLPLLSF